VVAALVTLIAACQTTLPDASSTAGSGAIGLGPTASPEPPPAFGPLASPMPPDVTTPVVLDPTLLGFLPPTVGGIAIMESVDEATDALDDPALPLIATAMDAGVAVDAANGNLVVAWVVRLRPDRFTDGIYQQWRDSYDEGACAAAGGALGRAEATIDERTVYITSCVAGLRAYHVWLQDAGILISASAIGEANLGEQLMGNLQVPA
jgi:hypothetical protein